MFNRLFTCMDFILLKLIYDKDTRWHTPVLLDGLHSLTGVISME